ncbi:hypothetical protein [Streptomyces sp. NPDC096105]|uniref:hypothetical protein n=1 Tax=Streptomyces sp. NPDC096105 TaxID=3366074 RepID=UPI00382581FF
MPEETDKAGSVSQQRYEEIAAELREVVAQRAKGQFTIGDRALESEPMRPRGRFVDVEPAWTVHRVPASIGGEAERFSVIGTPPPDRREVPGPDDERPPARL